MSSSFLLKHPALLVLAVTPALLAAVALALSFRPGIYRRIQPWKPYLLVVTYLLTRFALFFIIYILLSNREIGGDIKWFQWEGLGALSGKLPYRDFRCWHSPLFPYIMAVPYGIWDFIASGVLAFIVFDALCIILLCKLTRITLGPGHVMDAAWLYTVNPAVWIITVRFGQDESVIACFLLLAIYIHLRGWNLWTPLVLALGVLCTKATAGVGMLIVYTYSRFKIRDGLIAALIVVAVCTPFLLAGADILQPLKEQSGAIAGVSFTNLVDGFLVPAKYSILLERFASVLTILVTTAAIYLGHRRGLNVLENVTAALLVFFLFVPVSYSFYRLWLIGPLGIYALKTKRMNQYALYSGLICVVDDFALAPAAVTIVTYPMIMVSLVILLMQAKIAYEIIFGKPLAPGSDH